MKKLTKKEIQHKLELLVWDYNIDKSKLYDLFTGKIEKIGFFDKKTLYARILNSFDWYMVLRMLNASQLKNILEPEITSRLFPRNMRKDYDLVREIIFASK